MSYASNYKLEVSVIIIAKTKILHLIFERYKSGSDIA